MRMRPVAGDRRISASLASGRVAKSRSTQLAFERCLPIERTRERLSWRRVKDRMKNADGGFFGMGGNGNGCIGAA